MKAHLFSGINKFIGSLSPSSRLQKDTLPSIDAFSPCWRKNTSSKRNVRMEQLTNDSRIPQTRLRNLRKRESLGTFETARKSTLKIQFFECATKDEKQSESIDKIPKILVSMKPNQLDERTQRLASNIRLSDKKSLLRQPSSIINLPINLNNKSLVPEHSFKMEKLNKLFVSFKREPINKNPSLKVRVIKIMNKLKQLCISPKELIMHKVFSTEPYEVPNARSFIKAAKNNDFLTVQELYAKNKYIVYSFDHTTKTALHWATIKENHKIMQFLIDCHSDVDAKDIKRKTPLHFAAMNNDVIACQMLLYYGADPFIQNILNMNAADITKSEKIKHLIKKVRKIIIISEWLPSKEKKMVVEEQLKNIYKPSYANVSNVNVIPFVW